MARNLLVVVIALFNTKSHSVTALKIFDPTVELRSSDLLLTPTASGNHPDTVTTGNTISLD